MTSLFSKAATLSINFLALPLLFRCLGARDFALYATLNAASGCLAYANLGIGPKLVTATAAAFSERDKSRIQQLASSVMYPILAIATAVALTLVGYLFMGQPELALGSGFIGRRGLVQMTGLVLIGTAWFQVIASIYEAVQTGYHEQGVQNLFFGGGNLVSLFALVVLVKTQPTIAGAICCLTIPMALSRAVNIVVLRKKYREVRPLPKLLNWRVAGEMLGSGLGYSMTSIGSFLNHQLPVLLVNHVLSPSLTSSTATLLTIVSLTTGLVTMITIPMCASIADSVANRDFGWIRTFVTKLISGTIAYSVIVALVLCTIGTKLLLLAFGRQLVVERTTLMLVSAYVVFVLVEHVLVMTLIALGQIWQTAALYLIRGAAAAALVMSASRVAGVNGVFIVLIALVITVTLPTYYLLLRNTYRTLTRTSTPNLPGQLCESAPAC